MLARVSSVGTALAEKLGAQPFFLAITAVTAAASLLSPPHLSAIRWNVLAILFSQMLVCAAFEECRLLSCAAEATLRRFHSPRRRALVLVLVTGAMSMLVTNDIALLTMVPLTMGIARITGEDPYIPIILETVSANLMSALTPFGNPQNLYLYSFYKISPESFFSTMLPFGALGILLLVAATLILSKGTVRQSVVPNIKLQNRWLLWGAFAAFLCNLLAVLRILDVRISLTATAALFLVLSPRLFRRVDFTLLATFVLFFLFSDSITSIPAAGRLLSALLHSERQVLLFSAAASQVISNVPAAVLLSGFTTHAQALLYGVSAGGLGTLVASLASLISYRLYASQYPARRYLRLFFILNFLFLIILLIALLALIPTET